MSPQLRIPGFLLAALALLLTFTSRAQVPSVTCANGGGAPRAAYSRQAQGSSIMTDAAGNTYVTGSFRDTLALGAIRLVSAGDYDVYVAKLNAAGEYQWATQATGRGWDISNGIALDGAGNLYITGYSEGFELNFGGHKLTNPGFGAALYVAQLSPAGTWQRATMASSTGYTFSYTVGTALAVDGAGAVYVTGGLNGNVQFGATTLSNGGSYGVFVAKLSPTGAWQWATLANGSYDFGQAIALDKAGDPYITGSFESRQVTFGAFTLTNNGFGDIFVAKLTAAGAWQWVAQGGRYGDGGRGIALDAVGNAYITGAAAGNSLRFGPLALTKPDTSSDLFVAKLDAAGTWQWVALGGSADSDYGIGILLRGNSLTVAGGLGGPTARFGALPPVAVSGESDAGVVQLDTNGQWRWPQAEQGAR